MTTELKSVLKSISHINNSYDKVLSVTGEKFNVFQILKMESNEVRLHSSFIAELLDPKGSHGQKDFFLKSFIRIFNIRGIELDKEIFAQVIVEEFAGRVDLEIGSGGRMDIVIKTGDVIVVIENKINAGDQPKQLIRYNHHYPTSHLIYLTPEGKSPEDFSITNDITSKTLILGEDYFTASYKNDIVKWLLECRKQSVQHPLLRETISQYINLIKYLTGQTMNAEKENSIVNVLTENGNAIKAAIEINGSLNMAKKKLLHEFASQIEKRVSEKFSTINIEIDPDFGDKFRGMKFKFPAGTINWLYLSFAGHQSFPYLEMYNDANVFAGNKFEKKQENIQYYIDKLNQRFTSWGKIENVKGAWRGDWVCRYNKLDRFNDGDFWAPFADNDFTLAEEVSNDIILLLSIMR